MDRRDIESRITERFVSRVLAAAALPSAREHDIRQSCNLQVESDSVRLTCTITGSTYDDEWDGSEAGALAFADAAADDTAHLVGETQHYAWLRAGT